MFVAIDPIGLLPIFLSLTGAQPSHAARRTALLAVSVAAGALLLFALIGEAMLGALGITLPAFRVAGGLLLFLIALEMLFGQRSARKSQAAARAVPGDEAPHDVAVFPLAVPLICGPGAIASILLLMSQAPGWLDALAVLLATAAVLALTLLMFLLGARLAERVTPVLTDIATRLLGMLLAALAVQFVFDGLREGLLGMSAG